MPPSRSSRSSSCLRPSSMAPPTAGGRKHWVRCASSAGRSSRMRCCAPSRAASRVGPTLGRKGTEVATILIVDDRAVNRKFLIALLGFSGHQLLEAVDGEEALAAARAQRPDLIVTDIVMPGMDGIQLVERLRGDPLLAHTPVIFYTATYRLREARQLAAGSGVFAVLSKPSEPQTILATVNAALGLGAAPPPGLPISPQFEAGRERLTDLTGSMTEQFTALREFNEQLRGVLERGTEISREAPKVLELADRFLGAMNGLHSISLRLAGLLELSYELTLHHEPGRLLDRSEEHT